MTAAGLSSAATAGAKALVANIGAISKIRHEPSGAGIRSSRFFQRFIGCVEHNPVPIGRPGPDRTKETLDPACTRGRGARLFRRPEMEAVELCVAESHYVCPDLAELPQKTLCRPSERAIAP